MPVVIVNNPAPASAAQSVPLVAVYDYLLDAQGKPLANQRIKISLNYGPAESISPLTDLGNAAPIIVTTDSNGYWTANLIPNGNISPANTLYTVETPNHTYLITVGPTGPYQSTAAGTIVGTPAPLQAPVTPGPIRVSGTVTIDSSTIMAGPDPIFDITHPLYGAVVNTNSLAAINSATQAAHNVGGGLVFVPPGNFQYGSGTMSIYSNVTLCGTGMGSILTKTGNCAIVGNTVSNARVMNLQINCANINPGFNAIAFIASNNCRVEYVYIANATNAAGCIDFENGCTYCTAIGCYMTGSDAGVLIQKNAGAASSFCSVINCMAVNMTGLSSSVAWIRDAGCNGNVVMGCVTSVAGSGCTFAIGALYNRAIGNYFTSCTNQSGILNNGSFSELNGNVCLLNPVDGIDAGNSSGSTIVNNYCFGNQFHGIELNTIGATNSAGNTVTGNVCQQNGRVNGAGGFFGDGIRIQAQSAATSSDHIVIGNRCFDDAGSPTQVYGIREAIGGGGTVDNNLIACNNCRGNKTGAVLIIGPSTQAGLNLGSGYFTHTFQNIAYAASITPDASAGEIIIVGTLTGNITINAPTNPQKGQFLTFVFTNDGPGFHTASWNAIFKGVWNPYFVGNATSAITWYFDGTNWRPYNLALSSDGSFYLINVISSGFMQTFGQMLVGTNLQAGTQVYPGDLATSTQQTTNGIWRAAAVPANGNGNNGDRAISANGITYFKSGGVWYPETSERTQQAQPANPTGTTSATQVMMGLAQLFTPQRTGQIKITIYGDLFNATAGDGAQPQISFGTGGAPANGAAVTGTQVGAKPKGQSISANSQVTFCLVAIVTGLALGTQIWVDLALNALTGGAGHTATVENLSVAIEEI